MKRKHDITVRVTFNRAMPRREAHKALQMVLDTIDKGKAPIYVSDPELYIDRLITVETWK